MTHVDEEQFKPTSGNVSRSLSLAHNIPFPAYPSSLHYYEIVVHIYNANHLISSIVNIRTYVSTTYPTTKVITNTRAD